MLYVTTPPTGNIVTAVTINIQDTEKGAFVQIAATVNENDISLPLRNVSATLDWNDGSAAQSFPKTPGGSLVINSTRFLKVGNYVVRLRAQNYRAPVEDVNDVNFFVAVTSPRPAQKPQNYLFGPILPRDTGFPNASQWDFNTNFDLFLLESSVKMLLLTTKGDRIMEPDYGTDIRRILFDSQLDGIEGLIRDEVIQAFTVWEPRVQLTGLTVQADPNRRNVTVNLTVVSRLSKQSFETSVAFVQ